MESLKGKLLIMILVVVVMNQATNASEVRQISKPFINSPKDQGFSLIVISYKAQSMDWVIFARILIVLVLGQIKKMQLDVGNELTCRVAHIERSLPLSCL